MPFKRPFKGKGGARVALREAQAREAEIVEQMVGICREWRETFRGPRPVALSHRAPRQMHEVAWRMMVNAHGNQRFFSLFGSDEGLETLARCPPLMRQAIVGFERRRVELNVAYTYVVAIRRGLNRYLNDSAVLEQWLQSDRVARSGGAFSE